MNPPAFALRAGTRHALGRHVAVQLNNMFPAEGLEPDAEKVHAILPRALDRLRPILASVRSFSPESFNHFNSLQYATFLYLLGNEHWRTGVVDSLSDRLFCLNRALNSIDIFYTVEMPEVFFLSHGLSTVLGNAAYGNRLVVFQNVTVGRLGDERPTVGSNVVLYPGAVVTGASVIGHNSVVAAGTVVHGRQVPDNTVAMTRGTALVFKPRERDYADLYFRAPG